MSLLGLSRRLGASMPKPAGMLAASLSSRAVSTSLFKASATLQRSTFQAPLTAGNWRVSSKRHKNLPKTVRGMLDDDGVLRAPPVLSQAELAAQKAAIRASRPARTEFPMRKVYLRGKYRELFDKAQLMVVLHAIDSTSFAALKTDVATHFESAHMCTGLIDIEDKPYKEMVNLLRSTARVLYVEDPAKIIPALGALQRALKSYPNLLFLGGMVQGATSTSYDLEELLQFSSVEQIKGSIIPYLNAPAQIIPALQAPSMSLIRLLEHHSKVQGEAAAAPA